MFRLSVVLVAFLAASINANASFIAYNDLASSVPGEYAGTNVTAYSLGTNSALLTDYTSGAQPGYTLSVVGDGSDANVSGTTSNGANPDTGTDAYSVFANIVNMVRYIQGSGGAGFVDLVFGNLNPDKLYEVGVYGERSPAIDGRPTQFTVLGIEDFINDSSSGANFTGSSDPSVSYNTAPNFSVGYLARFTNIDSGIDGTFAVRVDQPSGSSQNWYVNAVSFGEATAVPEPTTTALLGASCLSLIVLILRKKKGAQRTSA
jgi:hypothetical protein